LRHAFADAANSGGLVGAEPQLLLELQHVRRARVAVELGRPGIARAAPGSRSSTSWLLSPRTGLSS